MQISRALDCRRVSSIGFLGKVTGYETCTDATNFRSVYRTVCLNGPMLVIPTRVRRSYGTCSTVVTKTKVVNSSFRLRSLLHFTKGCVPGHSFVC